MAIHISLWIGKAWYPSGDREHEEKSKTSFYLMHQPSLLQLRLVKEFLNKMRFWVGRNSNFEAGMQSWSVSPFPVYIGLDVIALSKKRACYHFQPIDIFKRVEFFGGERL